MNNKITIEINGKTKSEFATVLSDNALVKDINEKYPEMAMMLAMEECNELAIAISKCVRNGSADKKDNLAEEIVDVLTVIQWAINRFGITADDLNNWIKHKSERLVERSKTDEIVFRSNDAKDAYESNRINDNSLMITRGSNSRYEVTGDTGNIPEYYHVLRTHLMNQMSEVTESPKEDNYDHSEVFDFVNQITEHEKTTKSSTKPSKRTTKELNKIIERASKNAKKVDKTKKGKKGKK